MLSVFEQEEERLRRNEPHDFWFPPPDDIAEIIDKGKGNSIDAHNKMADFEKGGPVNGSGAYPLLSAGEYHEYIAKDLGKAVACYKEAVKLYPDDGLPSRASQAPFTVGVWANIQIAICLQKQGLHEDAVQYYEHHYPWRMFWFEIAECHKKANNKPEAKKFYKMAAEYHIEGSWGSSPELAFRAAVALNDNALMKQAVAAVKKKYSPAAARATLEQMRDWAEKTNNKDAIKMLKENR